MDASAIAHAESSRPAPSKPGIGYEGMTDDAATVSAAEAGGMNPAKAAAVQVTVDRGFAGFGQSYASVLKSDAAGQTALKTVEVVITYDFENADSSDPEEKKLSAMYRSLSSNKTHPVWSPDGGKLAFCDNNYGIWMVPSEGGVPSLIYDNYYTTDYKGYKLQLGGLETLGFSPNGKEVAFLRQTIDVELGTTVVIDDEGPQVQITVNNPIPVIESVNIENGFSRIIARNALSGRWSYDGRYFTYARLDRESTKELVINDTYTGFEWTIEDFLTSPIEFPLHDAYFMFSESDLYRVEEEKGILEQCNLGDNAQISDISRDGKWILYTDTRGGRRQFVSGTRTGETVEVFPGMDIQPYWAKFSPDATKICFCQKTGDNGGEWTMFIHDLDLTGSAAGIAETSAPAVFELKGSYPNPFNLSTTIVFSIPVEERVSLVIYNIMGQKVRDLVSERMAPGAHSVVWNGRDDFGRASASGTYLSKLTAGKHTATGRMMLVK
jgi:hypothetical protein